VVFGGDDTVGEVTFAGKVDVGHVVVDVDASGHLAVEGSLSSGFHVWCINI